MKYQSNKKVKTGLLLSSLSIAMASAMCAQVSVAAEVRELEEVQVTARRRTENLQDVPIAVSAFGPQQIKERGIETEADLQMSTPGLQIRVTNSSNQLNYSIRGQTVDSFSNSQPAVLAYVNEVQATGVSASSFFDLESIQVLKGPQGTLFGRNATGGAVLYQTKKPEEEFGGYLKVGVGSYELREIEGAVNIPLTEKFAMRIAGLQRTRDGWQTNLYNGDKLAEDDTGNVRLSLSYSGEHIQNDFVSYFAKSRGKTEGLKLSSAYSAGDLNPRTGIPVGDQLFATFLYPSAGDPIQGLLGNPGFQGVTVEPANLSFLAGPAAASSSLATDNPRLIELSQELGFTGFADYLANVVPNLAYDEVINNESNDSIIDQTLITNSTTFEISDSMTLKNVFGYNKSESFQATDVDGSPFMLLKMGDENDTGPFGNGYEYNYDQLSNELQLSGEMFNDSLSYIAGIYYYKETFENNIPLKFIADYDTDPFGPAFTYHADVDDESESVFAQSTYALSEALNLTVGGRYTWETVTIDHLSDSRYVADSGFTTTFSQEVERPSWLISLDYRINDEHMVYAAHRGSWRTGGFNLTSINDIAGDNITGFGDPDAPVAGFIIDLVLGAGTAAAAGDGTIDDVPDSFRPEKAQDIEIGWKFSGSIGEMPARVNLAAYQQVVEDVQRTVYLDITSLTGNVEEAEVKGVEIDAQIDLADWLEIGGAFAYTDAEFTKPLGDVAGFNFEFGPYADAPEEQWSVYFLTQTDLDGLGRLTFRGDYYSNGDTFYSNLNDSIGPETELDSYKLINFRVSLADIAGSGVTAVAYVRNASDEEYERGGLSLAGVTGSNATIIGEPRTWGLQLSYDF